MAYKHPFSLRIDSARAYRGLDKGELSTLMGFSSATLARRMRSPNDWSYGELRKLEGILKIKLIVDE